MSPHSVWPEEGRSVLSWPHTHPVTILPHIEWDIKRRKEEEEGAVGDRNGRDNSDKKAFAESKKEVPVGRGVGEK